MKKSIVAVLSVAGFAGAVMAQQGLADLANQAKQLTGQAVAISTGAAASVSAAVKNNFGATFTVTNAQLVVTSVTAGSQAAKSGLKKDDIITAINDVNLSGMEAVSQFSKIVALKKEHKLKVLRPQTLTVKVVK